MKSESGLTDEKGNCGGYLEKCDTNGNGRITCAEARKCGLKTPITKSSLHCGWHCGAGDFGVDACGVGVPL